VAADGSRDLNCSEQFSKSLVYHLRTKPRLLLPTNVHDSYIPARLESALRNCPDVFLFRAVDFLAPYPSAESNRIRE
jgi:hypothetical protein